MKLQAECHLEMHPTKTKIVYCKDENRKGKYPNVKFDFLACTWNANEPTNSRLNQEKPKSSKKGNSVRGRAGSGRAAHGKENPQRIGLEGFRFLLSTAVHQPIVRIPATWEIRMCVLAIQRSNAYCVKRLAKIGLTTLDSVPLAQEKMFDSFSTPAPERSPAQRSAGEGTAEGTAA